MIGSFIMTTGWLMHHISCRVFWQNIKSPRWLSPLQPRFGALWLLAFPKTKITFEREEISDWQWDSGKYDGAADGDWENYVRSHGAYYEGDWGVIVLCTMFLVSFIFFYKRLYFSCHTDGYFWDRPHHTQKICKEWGMKKRVLWKQTCWVLEGLQVFSLILLPLYRNYYHLDFTGVEGGGYWRSKQ